MAGPGMQIGILQSEGLFYVVHTGSVADYLGTTGPDHEHSGDITIALGTFSPTTRVRRATLRLGGESFRGKLDHFAGATVSASPTVYQRNVAPVPPGQVGINLVANGQQAFIVDFGGMRSLLSLGLSIADMTLVLPWMGTQFGPPPLFGDYDKNSATMPTTFARTVNFTGVDTQKLFVQMKVSGSPLTAEQFATGCRIVTATLPANVTASINGRLPFFTNPGQLTEEVEVTGLAEDLNALLSQASEEVEAQVLLSTDAPGVLLPQFDVATDLEQELSAEARWAGAPSVELPVRSLEATTLPIFWPQSTSAPWLVRRVTIDLGGAFPPWRAHSVQSTDEPGKLALKISAQFGVARRIDLTEAITLHGVALLLRVAADAELAFELVVGESVPGDRPPLAALELVASPGSTEPAWRELLLAAPQQIDPGVMWIVAKARKGSAEWVGLPEAGPPGASLFSDQGGPFEAYPLLGTQSATAQARLLRTPLVQENEPLVELTWSHAGSSRTVTVTPTDSTTTVTIESPGTTPPELTPGADGVTLELAATALATGTLTVERAVASYEEGV
ncbi:MAG: hypothetical protein ACRDKZ_02280 [Actinomycetota bacterium]